MAVQMEKNEIPCRRLLSPPTVGSEPCVCRTCQKAQSSSGRLSPSGRGARTLGLTRGTARILATCQSRNDQKLGTNLNVEEMRMKAVKLVPGSA